MRQTIGRIVRGPAVSTLACTLLTACAAFAQAAGRGAVPTAAQRADWPALLTAVRSGADVNAVSADGSTALLLATYRQNPDVVRALVAARADVNKANRYGLSPLLQAARLGDAPMVELLVTAGADIRGNHPQGETPLMAAAGAGSAASVRLLIAKGSDVNARETVDRQSALMWAAAGGHVDVVRQLLAAGANPNFAARASALSRNRMGDSGRMWVDHPSGGLTAVMFAARQGHEEIVRLLADAGADLSYKNPDGLSAMMVALINDYVDVAALLLEKGATVDDGSLYEAVQVHNLRTNETTGEATRPRIPRPNKTSPLTFIERLLARGADPMRVATHYAHIEGILAGNSGSAEGPGETPFARALWAQDVAAVRLMLKHGAQANAVLGAQSPLRLAMGIGGGRGFSGGFGVQPGPYRHVSERGIRPTVTTLLDAGADVNAVTPSGDTALHGAAQTGNLELIRVLIDNGASLEVRNKGGFTPLDTAMGRGAPPGRGGRGGPQVQAEAAALLRRLMGLPSEPMDPPGRAAGAGPGSGRGGGGGR